MRISIGRVLRLFLNLPSTIYINFKTLHFSQAIRLPIVVMSRCKMNGLKKGSIIINENTKFGAIIIGAIDSGNIGLPTNPVSVITIKNDGKIVFNGSAGFGKGTGIISKGVLTFGDKFDCNINCFISCDTNVYFEQEVQLGWNVHIRDSDGHKIYGNDGDVQNLPKPITIGEHCWIAANASILKGVNLNKNTVVGWGSVVVKSTESNNTVIAGNPAKEVKRNISWQP